MYLKTNVPYMQIIFSDSPQPQQITHSIFLAGPSPRKPQDNNWRIEAIEILKKLNFTGQVFIPIPKEKFYNGQDENSWTYLKQIQWECSFRHIADKIVFWVPRSIAHEQPGFTTNVEFGEDLHSGKIIYGRPDNADKCRYLDERIKQIQQPIFNTLEKTLEYTVTQLTNPSVRDNGEIFIPLHIWQDNEFQTWYTNLKNNGNQLIEAKVLHHYTVGQNKLFSYVLKVNIFIKSENRYKDNEFVFFRKSISSVLAFYEDTNTKQTYIVLIKEFRSPVNNNEGYIYELPSGSSFDNISPQENAKNELLEETGIVIDDINRFICVSNRQIAATLSSNKCHLYKVQLTQQEFNAIDTQKIHGENLEYEQTHVVICKKQDALHLPLDYNTIGMIFCALQ